MHLYHANYQKFPLVDPEKNCSSSAKMDMGMLSKDQVISVVFVHINCIAADLRSIAVQYQCFNNVRVTFQLHLSHACPWIPDPQHLLG